MNSDTSKSQNHSLAKFVNDTQYHLQILQDYVWQGRWSGPKIGGGGGGGGQRLGVGMNGGGRCV